jgi:ATP/maltotriose-dependent transcriptional regulator MalT
VSTADSAAVKGKLGDAARMMQQTDAMAKRILDAALDRLATVSEELKGASGEKYESLLEERGTLEQVISTEQAHMARKS